MASQYCQAHIGRKQVRAGIPPLDAHLGFSLQAWQQLEHLPGVLHTQPCGPGGLVLLVEGALAGGAVKQVQRGG
jgi:hypothetical protein